MTTVSLLIATHNRAALLARTLDHLSALRIPSDAAVDLLVVGNACTDSTAEVVASAGRQLAFPVRYINEPQLGVAFARNRCLREGAGEILMFLDDDVWPEPHWLEAMLAVFATAPADIVGGRVDLWWEAVSRPKWFNASLEDWLGTRDHGNTVRELTDPNDALSANLGLRRGVLEKIGGFTTGLGRTGNRLLSCEERDFLARALAAGCRMYYAPGAAVKHWVAPHRVTPKYLRELGYGVGQSFVYMKTRFGPVQICRTVAGHGLMLLRYTANQTVAAVRGRQDVAAQFRILQMMCLGAISGSVNRVLGRSPVHGSTATGAKPSSLAEC